MPVLRAGVSRAGLLLSMVAVRGILAGEQVYISYTELLAPTLARQHALLTNKLFLCQVSSHVSRVTCHANTTSAV